MCVDSDMLRRIRRERRAREVEHNEDIELGTEEGAPFLRDKRIRDSSVSLPPPYEPENLPASLRGRSHVPENYYKDSESL